MCGQFRLPPLIRSIREIRGHFLLTFGLRRNPVWRDSSNVVLLDSLYFLRCRLGDTHHWEVEGDVVLNLCAA
jgi:hypothetical protein